MRGDLLSIFSPPDIMIELVSIADMDIMKGQWRPGAIDPRKVIDELRVGLQELATREKTYGRANKTDQGEDPYRSMVDNAADLVELAIGASAIGALVSTSDTIRYIYGVIEKVRNIRERSGTEQLPYFTNYFQLMLLATTAKHREPVMNAVLEATGLSKGIVR